MPEDLKPFHGGARAQGAQAGPEHPVVTVWPVVEELRRRKPESREIRTPPSESGREVEDMCRRFKSLEHNVDPGKNGRIEAAGNQWRRNGEVGGY